MLSVWAQLVNLAGSRLEKNRMKKSPKRGFAGEPAVSLGSDGGHAELWGGTRGSAGHGLPSSQGQCLSSLAPLPSSRGLWPSCLWGLCSWLRHLQTQQGRLALSPLAVGGDSCTWAPRVSGSCFWRCPCIALACSSSRPPLAALSLLKSRGIFLTPLVLPSQVFSTISPVSVTAAAAFTMVTPLLEPPAHIPSWRARACQPQHVQNPLALSPSRSQQMTLAAW